MESYEEGFDTPCSRDETALLGTKKKKKKRRRPLFYNPRCDHTTINFKIGMPFDNAK